MLLTFTGCFQLSNMDMVDGLLLSKCYDVFCMNRLNVLRTKRCALERNICVKTRPIAKRLLIHIYRNHTHCSLFSFGFIYFALELKFFGFCGTLLFLGVYLFFGCYLFTNIFVCRSVCVSTFSFLTSICLSSFFS